MEFQIRDGILSDVTGTVARVTWRNVGDITA
jgi:hypothetical protein